MTTSAQYISKNGVKMGNNAISMLITDTPGDTIHLTAVSMTNAVFVFLIYDVTDKKSFENLDSEYIQCFINNCKHENRILYIIGNKSENGTPRQVSEDQGRELAESYNFKYFETSAKTGANVEKVFTSALEEVCKNLANNKYDPKTFEKVGIKKLA